jgi:hypothetical protein
MCEACGPPYFLSCVTETLRVGIANHMPAGTLVSSEESVDASENLTAIVMMMSDDLKAHGDFRSTNYISVQYRGVLNNFDYDQISRSLRGSSGNNGGIV